MGRNERGGDDIYERKRHEREGNEVGDISGDEMNMRGGHMSERH